MAKPSYHQSGLFIFWLMEHILQVKILVELVPLCKKASDYNLVHVYPKMFIWEKIELSIYKNYTKCDI